MQPIEDLQKQVSEVALQDTRFQHASDAQHAVEVALVQRVLEIVKPALRALCTRPEIGHVFHVGEGDTETQRASWSGLLLRGPSEPQRKNPRDNAGNYSGVGWYVLPDLTLRRIDYDGGWSRWDGSRNEARSTQHTVTLAELLDWESAESIVAKIVASLDQQIAGNKTKQTKAMLARAEKLRAVLLLLEGAK